MKTKASLDSTTPFAIRFFGIRCALLLAVAVLTAGRADGGSATWNNAGATDWLTTGNWNPSASYPGTLGASGTPGQTDVATFGTAGISGNACGIGFSGTSINLSLGSILWNMNAGSAATIANSSTTVNGTLQLNGASVNVGGTGGTINNLLAGIGDSATVDLTFTNANNSGNKTMGVNLNYNGGGTIYVANGRTLTISSIVSDGGSAYGFIKSGAGTLTLSGANTYTGATTVNGGTLLINGQAYFNVGRTNTIASGAMLNLTNSNNTLTSQMPVSSIRGAGTFRLSGNTTVNQSTGGSGNSRLTIGMSAGGLIDLQDTAQLFNGGWQIILWTSNQASLNIASGAKFDFWDGYSVYVDALTGSGTVDKGYNANNGNSLYVGVAGGSGTFSGVLKNAVGTLNLVKTGAGTQVLSGTNTYTGTTTVNGGTLKIDAGAGGSLSSSSTLTFGGSGSFTYDNTTASGAKSQNMGALTFSSGEDIVTSTRTASQTVSLTFSSLAARTAGATGNFVVNLGGGVNGTDNKIVLTGTTGGTLLNIGEFFNGSNYAATDAGGTLYVRAYGSGDTGYLACPAAATLGSPTSSSNGQLTTGNITAQTTASINTLNMATNSLTFQDTASTLSINGIVSSGSASAQIANGSAGSFLQPTGSGGEMVIRVNGASDVLTIAPAIQNNTNPSPLTKSGAGALILSGANTYSGTTTINGGTLQINGQAYFNVGRTTTIASGAVLNLTNSNNSLTSLMPVSTINGAGTFRLSGNTTINQTSNGTAGTRLTIAMSVGGLIDLRDTAKLTNGGWQELLWTSNLASLNIASGATFDVWDGNPVYVDALTGAGTVDKGGGNTGTYTLNVGVAGGSGVFSGVIKNSASSSYINLVKSGAGTQVLSGTNTYTGTTAVNGGTLLVNGSLNVTSLVTIAGVGTLGGTGTVGIVTNNGTLAPGNGAVMGALTTSNLTLNAGCTNAFDLGVTNASDSVTVNGVLTLGGGVITVTTNTGFSFGTYKLFGYTSTSGGTVPTLLTTLSGYPLVTVTNNTAVKQVQLRVLAIPTVATAAAATPATTGGTNTMLSVLGADADGGETNLTYTWSKTSGPAGATYNANSNNAAKNTTVTFAQSGSYSFQVVVMDQDGLSATSSVAVTVTQTVAAAVTPSSGVILTIGATQPFAATFTDQFGLSAATGSTNWAVLGGIGTVDSSGLFTANNPGSGYVTAENNGTVATASVSVVGSGWTITASAGAHGTVSPNGAVTVPQGSNQTFTVSAAVGYHIADVLVDSVSQGAIASYTFTNVTTTHTISAWFTNDPPTVVVAATAMPMTVTSTSTVLSVVGADTESLSSLTYTWTTTAGPGSVAFSANSTPAASNTTAAFTNAGAYTFQVVIADPPGLTATSTVAVTVNQTLTGISVTPSNTWMYTGATQQFTVASTRDQFGNAMSVGTSCVWSAGGAGTIDATPTNVATLVETNITPGAYQVTCSQGGVAVTAQVAVVNELFWDGTANNWETAHWSLPTGGVMVAADGGRFAVTNGTANATATPFPNAALRVGTGGTLAVTATATSTGTVTLAGGTLSSGGTYTFTNLNGLVLGSGTDTVNVTALTLTLPSPISGPGTLLKSGVGTLTLTASNTFSGGLLMSNGTLRLSGTQGFTGGVTLHGGSLGDSTTAMTSAALNGNSITVAANAAASFKPASGESFPSGVGITINPGATLDLGPVGSFSISATYSGVISGSGTLDSGNVNNNSTITLGNTGNTNFTGNVYLHNGQNITLNVSSFGDGGKVTYNHANGTSGIFNLTNATANLTFNTRQFVMTGSAGGALQIGNYSTNAFAINTSLDASGLTTNRTLALAGTGAGLSTFGGVVPNASNNVAVSVSKIESGTWVLSGTNTYTGPTTISAGILEIGSAGMLGGGAYVASITNNATLRYNSTAAQTISGAISGTGVLIKASTGTLILSGTNTYSGATTVSNGTLLVNGSSVTSVVTVASAGTFGGAGTVGIVTNNGTLSPGNGAIMGTLTTSNLVLNVGCTNAFDLGVTNASDMVAVNGTLTLNGGVLAVTTNAGFSSGTYTLFSYTNSSGSTLPTLITTIAGYPMSVTNDATARKVLLQVKAVPTVATPAAATPATTGGTNTLLTVLGADQDGGEANLTYTWSKTSGPAGETYSVNGDNAAKNTTVTFAQAGVYGFQVVIADLDGLKVTSTVSSVTATQTATTATLTPPSMPGLLVGSNQQFSAAFKDQFGQAMAPAGTNWAVLGGIGSIDGAGLFTATNAGSGSVVASFGSAAGTSAVTTVLAGWTITASGGPNGTISPSGGVTVEAGSNQAFTITADPNYHIADVLVDSVSQGGVGSYTFTNVTSAHTIAASFGNDAPTVAVAATATPSPVTSTSAVLAVVGADTESQSSLTYTWTRTAGPGSVTFSANGSHAASNTTAAFTNAGAYTFQVVIADPPGLTATSTVAVTVNQTLTGISVTPSNTWMYTGATQLFTVASARDQFGNSMSVGTAYVWSAGGAGTIDATPTNVATLVATNMTPAAYQVTCSQGGVAVTAQVAVANELFWDGTANNWETAHWTLPTGGVTVAADGGRFAVTNGTANAAATPFPNAPLRIGSGGTLAVTATATSTGTVTLAGGTLSSAGTYTLTNLNGMVLANGTSTVSVTANTLTLPSPISGPGTLRKDGGGTLTLTASNTFSGGLVMSNGTLRLSGTQGFTGGVTLHGGVIGDATTPATAAALNNNTITVAANATTGFHANNNEVFGPSVSITINPGATLDIGLFGTFSLAATYNGVLSGSGTLDSGSINGVTAITLGNTNNTGFTGNVLIRNQQSWTLTVSSFGDNGKVTHNGFNSVNGIFNLGAGATAPLTFNTRQFVMTGSPANCSLQLGNYSAQPFTINTALDASTLTGARTLALAGTGAGLSTFGGLISNGGATVSLSKSESGTWAVTNANTYTGNTTVGAGTLSANTIKDFGTASALGQPASGAIQLGSGANTGTLTYTGVGDSANRTFQIGDTTAGNAGGGKINSSGSDALSFTAANFNATIAGITATRTLTLGGTYAAGANQIQGVIQDNVAGTGKIGLTKNADASIWILSGSNTYSGATTVSGGTLRAGVASVENVSGAFGKNSAVTLNNTAGAVLDLNGYNTQVGSLSGGGTTGGHVTLSNATLTVGGDNTSQAYTGVVSGVGGALTKIGTGTQTLAGTNTYTGDTTIHAGTLALSGSGSIQGSAHIVLASGANFDVSGRTGTLTNAPGQTLELNATGGNASATNTVATGKGLTLSTGGIAFTNFSAGSTAPLVVAGTGGALAMNGAPVSVEGTLSDNSTYVLIGKSGSAAVTGTPGTLTINGVPNAAGYSVTVVGGQLLLTTPQWSGSIYRFR